MRELSILVYRELRSAYRESSVVLYSVLLPMLFYPFLLWLMVTAASLIQGQQYERIYRVAYDIKGASEEQISFYTWLDDQEQVELVEGSEGNLLSGMDEVELKVFDDTELLLTYRGDSPVSQDANVHLRGLLADYTKERRDGWLRAQGYKMEAGVPFTIESTSTVASAEMGGYLLGAVLPIGVLIMIALGGAYPAIDTTAGERERGTWETLQSCGPNLSTILISKYLFVTLVCFISGMLNLVAMLVSIRSLIAPILRDQEEIAFQISTETLLILVVGVAIASLFVAAALLLCAIFARTFREGQALTTPMFMMIALPILPLSDPRLELSSTLAMVPLVNLALVWREALRGNYDPALILQTMVILGGLVAGALWLGSHLLKNETLMSGAGPENAWESFKVTMREIFSVRGS